MKSAEGVDEAIGKKISHLLAFLIGESCILAIGLGILEVYLPMCHIKVAAKDNRLLAVQILEIGKESLLPCHAVVKSAKSVLRVGSVASDKIKRRHLESDDTSLMVVLINAYAISNGERSVAGVYGS